MSKIRIANGPMRGREKTLVDKPVTIGRDAEAGLQILDRSASRFHCELFPVGGMWFVRDLESKNGTSVNDEKLKDEELLRVGDVIKIGATEMIFESGAAVTDDDSSNRVAYSDDAEMLSNTLEFRLDELSDISEPTDHSPIKDNAKSLRILYQVGRIVSEASETPDREARVLDSLIASMPADCALIFRRDAATGKLTPTVVRTAAPHIQPVISRSIIKKTFTENKALHSADAQDDDRFASNKSVVLKGIRSVICVPLTTGGKVVGVLYLSRGTVRAGSSGFLPAFDQLDLELVSAAAIQLGLAHTAHEERVRHRESIHITIRAMVTAMEGLGGCRGAGDGCARTCVALASAMHLDGRSRERLQLAGLLHALSSTNGAPSLAVLEQVPELEAVVALVRLAHERIDGSGPGSLGGDDLDTEARLLAVAAAHQQAICAMPDEDGAARIETLIADAGLDRNLTQLLMGCHLDGSLYHAPTGVP